MTAVPAARPHPLKHEDLILNECLHGSVIRYEHSVGLSN